MGVCAVAPDTWAARYYVDKRSPVASDKNPGTANLPWQTLWKASRAVRPGDTVIVKPGYYRERLNFYSGNLANAPERTVFAAQQGARFYGADTLFAPKLTLNGFTVDMPASVMNSDWTARYAFLIRSNDVKIVRNYVENFPGVGVQAHWAHPWPKRVIVRNNTFRRCNQGIVIHGEDWLVQGNEVDQLIDWGLDCDYMRFFGKRITIRRNYLHGARLSDVGASHVDGFQTFPNNGWYAENINIVGNYVESFHQGAMLGVADHANQSGYIRNLTFTNNVFVGGEIGGSWAILGVNLENLVIRNNLFFDMQYHGVGAIMGTNATVRSNIFYNAADNYTVDASSTMVGGYNVLNRRASAPSFWSDLDVVADPQFVNPSNLLGPDGRPRSRDDGYRLRSASPARDMADGKVTFDIYGQKRPVGGKPDAGPHEYTAAASRSMETIEGSTVPKAEPLAGQEAIEILLESSAPIDTSTIWADLPVPLQSHVRVEWIADESEPNALWIRISPMSTWETLARAAGLLNSPFSVTAGSADVTGEERRFVIQD